MIFFFYKVIALLLPIYGFSDAPIKAGLGFSHIGQMFIKLEDTDLVIKNSISIMMIGE